MEKGTLEKLSRACESGPGKFARALLRIVFAEEELRGRTLLGGKSNFHSDQPLKEALDPVRVQAVIGMYIDLIVGATAKCCLEWLF